MLTILPDRATPAPAHLKTQDSRLKPLRPISPATHRLRLAPLRTADTHQQTLATHETSECPLCEKCFTGAAIVTNLPEPVQNFSLANFTGNVVYRRLFCDHCDRIFTWYQESRPDGTLGEKIGETGMIVDPEKINKFLREHPQAAGVAQ